MTDDATTYPVAANAAKGAANPAPPADPAAGQAELGPAVSPLRTLLHFVAAVNGDYLRKIDDANAREIFEGVKAELPGLDVASISFGATAATLFASQMRSLAWRLRGNRGELPAERKKKKGKPLYVRKGESPEAAAARYAQSRGPAPASDDGTSGETDDDFAKRVGGRVIRADE
jgi:hypothetical protein